MTCKLHARGSRVKSDIEHLRFPHNDVKPSRERVLVQLPTDAPSCNDLSI